MTDDQLPPRKTTTGGDAPVPGPPSRSSQRMIGGSGVSGVQERSVATRVLIFLIVLVLTVGLATVWLFVAQRQLASSIAVENTQHLDHAQKAFELIRGRTHENLQALCRVMVEDPRLKSTLATEGMDEATVADILRDLGKLRRTGFLMVLSPEGRVFAQAGAEELRGLDLSDSSVVKKAQASPEAVVGTWVIGGKIMDLSIMSVRFGPSPIAYLVVGQLLDQALLKAVADQTGVAVASATGATVALTSSVDDRMNPVFAAVAAEPGTFKGRLFEIAGASYVTAISELEATAQARPRLVFVQSTIQTTTSFDSLRWMTFVPPFLVLLAVLFSMTANRRTVVVTRPSRRME